VSAFWDEVAGLPGLSPVTDYQPVETPWARYLTELHLRAIAEVRAPRPEERFLDYGCGVGRITRWLAPRVASVIAIDPSAPMIEVARASAGANVELRVHAGGPPPAEGALHELDGITAIWVLQHILDDREHEATLDFFAAALRPGGRLCTLDRLCREDPEDEAPSYLRLRGRARQLAALERRGLRVLRAHPVSVGEQVLGSPRVTGLVKRGKLPLRATAALDLAWARRQREPFLADHLVLARRD